MTARSTETPVPLGEFVPTADRRIILRGLDWAGYQSLLALRGERCSPRIAYIDGVAELMTPSRGHERIKSGLGRVLEAYCSERGIKWTAYGSWLIDDESEDAGLEPDECYVFGPDPEAKPAPDLAIEVVWTSGGIDKLEIYRRLGIREVWYWKRDAITVFVLGPDGYAANDRSVCLPDVDLPLLCRVGAITPTSDAIEELRKLLRSAPFT